MEYNGFDIRVEVSKNFLGPGFSACYHCLRESERVFQGVVVGNLNTEEHAVREAYGAAKRRIDHEADG